MKTGNEKKSLLIICNSLLWLLLIPLAILAQQQEPALLIDSYLEDEARLNTAIDENEKLLKKYPDAEFAPTVMFQLCELYARKSDLEYQQKMNDYEQALADYDKGELQVEPTMPRVSFEKSITVGMQLIERFPNTTFKDRVIYRLAMNHLDAGDKERAKEYFDFLVSQHENSPLAPESHFRIGEYYFERREFNNAVGHYRHLLNRWDNEYFQMALYKMGWAYYNLNDYANAITSLIYLVDDISLVEKNKIENGNEGKTDLRKESIDYISVCFTEYGGSYRAKKFLESKKNKEYVVDIFLKMADIYISRNFYDEAVSTYKSLIEFYPFYFEAPKLYTFIIEIYETAGDIGLANEARETLVKRFGPGSAWLDQYPVGEIRNNALFLAQKALYDLGAYYQMRAQDRGREREYRLAISKYNEYLEKFPESDKRYTVNYYLAECYYETGDFEDAALSYYQVMTEYEQMEYREQAAFNRILCYYNLTNQAEEPDTVTCYIDDFLRSGTLQAVLVRVGSQAQLIQACNDFDKYLPGTSRHHEVLMKMGETLYELSQYDLAVMAYQIVAEDSVQSVYTGQSITMIAQCYFRNEKYSDAEEWYRVLAATFPDSTEYTERAGRMIASSRFKVVEAIKDSGDVRLAAEEFEKLAETIQDNEVRQRAIYEAGHIYETINLPGKTTYLFEKLAREFPQSDFSDEALYRAGLLHQESGSLDSAAMNYMELARIQPESEYTLRALYNAGSCYESVSKWNEAKNAYAKYVAHSPTDHDEHLEALYKIGEMLYVSNRPREALAAFNRTIDQYHQYVRQGILADEYSAAHSQFMIGEIYFKDYCQIALVHPLEKNLARKADLLKAVRNAYLASAKYKVAEWATAASYKIGMAYEEFVTAFLESPRPANLTDEELAMYNLKLNEKAEPFKVQAFQLYKANVNRAEENNIDNRWISESRKRMQVLLIELGPSTGINLLSPDEPVGVKKG